MHRLWAHLEALESNPEERPAFVLSREDREADDASTPRYRYTAPAGLLGAVLGVWLLRGLAKGGRRKSAPTRWLRSLLRSSRDGSFDPESLLAADLLAKGGLLRRPVGPAAFRTFPVDLDSGCYGLNSAACASFLFEADGRRTRLATMPWAVSGRGNVGLSLPADLGLAREMLALYKEKFSAETMWRWPKPATAIEALLFADCLGPPPPKTELPE
jgi:hypothetical protein